MNRSQRLLQLIQLLREHRFPVAGAQLAQALGISLRTLYRDIATLQAQGAAIEGEPGLGYVLKPGFMLPPLMFSEEEIEALVLGGQWVVDRADPRLSAAARTALAKIASVLPADVRNVLHMSTLLVGPAQDAAPDAVDMSELRQAIRRERKLSIRYRDQHESRTQRVIWPFALGYFERVRVLVAWCEVRNGFRHFRCDRIEAMEVLSTRYPQHRAALLKAWRVAEGIDQEKVERTHATDRN